MHGQDHSLARMSFYGCFTPCSQAKVINPDENVAKGAVAELQAPSTLHRGRGLHGWGWVEWDAQFLCLPKCTSLCTLHSMLAWVVPPRKLSVLLSLGPRLRGHRLP